VFFAETEVEGEPLASSRDSSRIEKRQPQHRGDVLSKKEATIQLAFLEEKAVYGGGKKGVDREKNASERKCK